MVRFGRQTLKVTAVFAPDGKHVKYGVRSDP
jgi:hypothetical protein